MRSGREAKTVTAWAEESGATRADGEEARARHASCRRRELADLGVTVVRLSNGVEAWLKPTDFKNDQIAVRDVRARRRVARPARRLRRSVARDILRRTVGRRRHQGHRPREAARRQTLASASPFISLSSHGFNGSASPAELETALAAALHSIHRPRRRPAGLRVDAAPAARRWSPTAGAILAKSSARRLEQVNTSSHYTSQPLTPEIVASLDRAKMLSFYKARFANAADFTFFMVGAFKVDAVIPLLAQYVGVVAVHAARGRPRSRIWRFNFPTGDREGDGRKGTGAAQPDRHQLLRRSVRRSGPSRNASSPRRPCSRPRCATCCARSSVRPTPSRSGCRNRCRSGATATSQVSFGAAPENIQAMTDRVLQEVKRLQQEGPSADLTNRAKESARRGYETALRQNAYWLRRLQTIHMLGGDPGDHAHPARTHRRGDSGRAAGDVQEVLPLDRYTVVTLVPREVRSVEDSRQRAHGTMLLLIGVLLGVRRRSRAQDVAVQRAPAVPFGRRPHQRQRDGARRRRPSGAWPRPRSVRDLRRRRAADDHAVHRRARADRASACCSTRATACSASRIQRGPRRD